MPESSPEFDEDEGAALYDITQELTEQAGLAAYEVSNHAAPGQESRHNLLYWRYGEYAGIGPGAHSRLIDGANRRAVMNEKHPEQWRSLVEAQGHARIEDSAVAPPAQASEYLLMGLRIAEGIDRARYEGSGRRTDIGFETRRTCGRRPHRIPWQHALLRRHRAAACSMR